MRLQRFLARAGVASRRKAEELITSGRVSVNGEPATVLGTTVDPEADRVTVDGTSVTLPSTYVYYLLNKPTGFLTTMSDPQGRRTVAELVPSDAGLFPVGRLDMDTSGALLFTSDGEMSHRLTHPSFHADKTYRVLVDGAITDDEAEALARGVTLDDGPTRPADIEVLSASPVSSDVRITLREGRKRQVRRMLDHVGHPVLELHRESFGPVVLGTLPEGDVRELSTVEVAELRRVAGMEP
jgi:23S rRNA pseudouridine2605 synthase